MKIKCCNDCENHMTGLQMLETREHAHKVVGLKFWRYDHFCVGVKSGRRKIKNASDYNGTEWPKWCPMRINKP